MSHSESELHQTTLMETLSLGIVDDDTSCPTCGRADFKNEAGMKIHHVRTHGESIAGVQVHCANCGAPKQVHPVHERNKGRHFCDYDCMAEWNSDNLGGSNHPGWQGGKVDVECDWCGAKKAVTRYERDELDHHYCDKECEGRWLSANKAGEDSPSWKGGQVQVKCEYCGGGYNVVSSLEEESRFCSIGCKAKWQSENFVGENSPTWDGGGVDYYGPSYPSQRCRAMDRADGKCELCGMTQAGHRKLTGRDLHAHHKTPFRRVAAFFGHRVANALANLIIVCRACHQPPDGLEPISQKRGKMFVWFVTGLYSQASPN